MNKSTGREFTSGDFPTLLAIGIFLLGIGVVIVSGLGLAWDSGYQFVYTLENQVALVGYGRDTQLVLFAIVVWASQFTDNALFLAYVFQFLHLAFTPFALLASWLLVRTRRPALFVWIALGIGLVTLPAEACSVCQSVAVIHMGLVLLAAILVGMPRAGEVLAILLFPIMLFDNPAATPIFATLTVSAFVVGVREPDIRKHVWSWGLVFGGMSLAGVARAYLTRNDYEALQMQWETWQHTFDAGVRGLPLQMLVLAWLAGLLVFVQGHMSRGRRGVQLLALVSIILAGVVMIVWASDARAWANALEIRSWLTVFILPIIALAVLDSGTRADGFRRGLVVALAMIFAVTLLVQARSWTALTQELGAALAEKPGCLEARDIPDLHETALGNWTVTAQSFTLQGKQVQSIAYFYESCRELDFRTGYWLSNLGNWDYHFWDKGWFDKEELRQSLEIP